MSFLVIASSIEGSYLQSGDGTSQISASINAPRDDYLYSAAHALINGKLHVFGGLNSGKKVLFLFKSKSNFLRLREWTAALLTSFRRDSTKNDLTVTRHCRSIMAKKVNQILILKLELNF